MWEPIERWLSVPMMHFEPPSMVVRRFWAGVPADVKQACQGVALGSGQRLLVEVAQQAHADGTLVEPGTLVRALPAQRPALPDAAAGVD